MDEMTILKNIIKSMENNADAAFLRLRKAVDEGDKGAVVEAYDEWQLFENYANVQSVTLEMLKDRIKFGEV